MVRKQSMAWMEMDYSKHIMHFGWKIKWGLEHLGVLGIMGKITPLTQPPWFVCFHPVWVILCPGVGMLSYSTYTWLHNEGFFSFALSELHGSHNPECGFWPGLNQLWFCLFVFTLPELLSALRWSSYWTRLLTQSTCKSNYTINCVFLL